MQIGDAYVAVCGIGDSSSLSPSERVGKIIDLAEQLLVRIARKPFGDYLKLRVGVDIGQVATSVLGLHRVRFGE